MTITCPVKYYQLFVIRMLIGEQQKTLFYSLHQHSVERPVGLQRHKGFNSILF
jgi:hypothetical protein